MTSGNRFCLPGRFACGGDRVVHARCVHSQPTIWPPRFAKVYGCSTPGHVGRVMGRLLHLVTDATIVGSGRGSPVGGGFDDL